MKGISPFVASIMLIAFTVAAGAIISLWFTSFSQKTTAGVGEQTSAVSKCTGALKITFVSRNMSIVELTTSGVDGVNITSFVDSKGNIMFKHDGFELDDAMSIAQLNFTNDTGTYEGATNQTVSGNAQWVKASGICEYNQQVVPVEAVCYKGQSCWSVQ